MKEKERLVEYFTRYSKKGYSEDTLRSQASKQGWKPYEIDKAWKGANKSDRTTPYLIVATLFVLLALTLAYLPTRSPTGKIVGVPINNTPSSFGSGNSQTSEVPTPIQDAESSAAPSTGGAVASTPSDTPASSTTASSGDGGSSSSSSSSLSTQSASTRKSSGGSGGGSSGGSGGSSGGGYGPGQDIPTDSGFQTLDATGPVVARVNITPSSANRTISVSGVWNYTDAAGDAENGTTYTWFINGTEAWRDPALVGYWRLDGTGKDYAGSNDGTAYNTTNRSGIIKGAMVFNGNSSVVDLGNPASFPNQTKNRTICAWGMTYATSAGYAWIFAYGNASDNQAMFIGRNGNAIWGGGYGIGNDLQGSNWTNNTWKHICLTYNGTTGNLYTNGILENSSARSWNLVSNKSYIGKQVNGVEYWNGSIDEVKLWNRTLTATEIAQEFQMMTYGSTDEEPVNGTPAPDIPFSMWHFDDSTTGTRAEDYFGDHNATLVNGAAFGPGMFGANGVVYDGINDYAIARQFTNGNQLTLEAWIKPRTVTGIAYMEVMRQDEPAVTQDFLFSFQNSGKNLTFGLNTNSGGYQELQSTASQGMYADGNWHHVVAIYNGSLMMIYKDSQLVANTSKTGTITSTGTKFTIGAMYGGGGPDEFFNGTIDEVAVYNRALSEEEVNQSYRRGFPLFGLNSSKYSVGSAVIFQVEPVQTDGTLGEAKNSTLLNISADGLECGVVTQSATMNKNLNSSGYACFNITASNVTIDCAGFSINGSNTNYLILIYNSTSTTIEGVVIKNCNLRNGSVGIYGNYAKNTLIINNTFANMTTYGVLFDNRPNQTIENNTFLDHMTRGVVLNTNAGPSRIIGNRFQAVQAPIIAQGYLNDAVIANNIINVSDSTTEAIHFIPYHANNVSIINNTIQRMGTAVGIALSNFNNSIIANNTINGIWTAIDIGDYESSYVVNSTIVADNSIENGTYAITINPYPSLTTPINNLLIQKNRISNFSYGIDDNDGGSTFALNNTRIINNTFNCTTWGITLTGGSNISRLLIQDNLFWQRNIIFRTQGLQILRNNFTAPSPTGIVAGISIINSTNGTVANNTFSFSTVMLNVTRSNLTLIDNRFFTYTFSGVPQTAIRLSDFGGTGTSPGSYYLQNNTFNDLIGTSVWMVDTYNVSFNTINLSANITVENTTKNVGARLTFIKNVSVGATSRNVREFLNISSTQIRLNASIAPEFNTTAVLRFNTSGFSRPTAKVDYLDNGALVNCPSSRCVNLSNTGGYYTFNVSSFTGYQLGEEISCNTTLNENLNLSFNLTANGTCFTLNKSGITLDCAGYSILGNNAGTLINSSIGTTGLIIKNCKLGNASVTIRLLDSNDTRIYNITGLDGFENISIGTNDTHQWKNLTIAASSNLSIEIFGNATPYGLIENNTNVQLSVQGSAYNMTWNNNTIISNTGSGSEIANRMYNKFYNNIMAYLSLDNGNHSQFINNSFVNNSKIAYGVMVDGFVVNNTFQNMGAGHWPINMGTYSAGPRNIYLANNTFQNTTTLQASGSNVTIISNKFLNGTTGLSVNGADQFVFIGNNINGTTDPGISLANTNGTVIENNSILSAQGLVPSGTTINLIIRNNRFQVSSYALTDTTPAPDNVTIEYNVFQNISNPTNMIYANNAKFNRTTIRYNNFSGGDGIIIGFGGGIVQDNVIDNNIFQSAGQLSIRLNFPDRVLNTTITNNLFNQTGNAIRLVQIQALIANNTIISDSGGAMKASIALAGSNTTLLDNLVNNSPLALLIDNTGLAPSSYYIRNLTMVNIANRSIKIMNTLNVTINETNLSMNFTIENATQNYTSMTYVVPVDLSAKQYHLADFITFTNVSVRVNSSFAPEFNTTAHIRFNATGISYPKVKIDTEDDGSFINCPSTICTNLSNAGGFFVFNVSGFTTYEMGDSAPCGITLNGNVLLTENLTSQGNCYVINKSGITLDCSGNQIAGDTTGELVNTSSGLGGITIQNCTLMNASTALRLINLSNSTIRGNTFTSTTIGVEVEGSQANLTIDRNYINNTQTGLSMNKANNTVISNNTIANTSIGILASSSINAISHSNLIANATTGIRINDTTIGSYLIVNATSQNLESNSLHIENSPNVTISQTTLPANVTIANTTGNLTQIIFNRTLTLTATTDLAKGIQLKNNFAFVNTTLYPALNKTAVITINATSTTGTAVLVDYGTGALSKCPASICTVLSTVSKKVVFAVRSFSTYQLGNGVDVANLPPGLTITDSNGNPIADGEIGALMQLRLANRPLFEFNLTNSTDLQNLNISYNDTAIAIAGWTQIENVTPTHAIYIPNFNANAGTYVCPHAYNLTAITTDCPGVMWYQGPFPQTNDTEAGSVTVSIAGDYYRISGLNQSGSEGFPYKYVKTNATALQPAAATVYNASRFASSEGGAANASAQGGNTSQIDFFGNGSTSKWQGYYGNATGRLVLGQGQYDFYNFTRATPLFVAVTQDQNFNFAGIKAANKTRLDQHFGFNPSDTDSATLTFNDTGKTLGGIGNVPYAPLEGGTWFSGIYDNGTATDLEGDARYYAFGVEINQSETNFFGSTSDFELLVGLNETAGVNTNTVYFFMQIQ